MYVADLLRIGSQWTLGVLSRYVAAWAKKLFYRLSIGIVIVLFLSLTIPALWKTTSSVDFPLVTSEDAVAMANKQWWKHPGINKILKDALLYLSSLLSSYEPLTMENLLKHRDQLGGMKQVLYTCFDLAIKMFIREPLLVQQNARMVIQCDGPPIEFLAGNGDCEILVCILNNQFHHEIRELTPAMYLARMAVREEPLSIHDLQRVRHRLQSLAILSEAFAGCMDFAVQEFAKEPVCTQDSARMVLDCGGEVAMFVSGKKNNYINVYDARDGTIHYSVTVSGVWTKAARFFNGNQAHAYTRIKKPLQLE